MTSGSRLFHLALALVILPASASLAGTEGARTNAAQTDAAALIRELARPAPASIEFTEVRFSPLLKAPLIVGGQLGYTSATNLDRHVERPYREDTEIRGDSVRVMREGEPVRSFALKRAPELRVLLSGFAALLSGDPATVERTFEVSRQPNGAGWTLELTPHDARVRKRLQKIVVHGRDSTPACFSIATTDGGASIMLLGETARVELPANVERRDVERRCAPGDSTA